MSPEKLGWIGPKYVLSLFTCRKLLIEHYHCPDATMDALPDDTLIEIFDFYRLNVLEPKTHSWTWHTLVHVCKRWRTIIFSSPRSLDVQLLCKHRIPVRDTLDYFPPLPIILHYIDDVPQTPQDEDSIIAALARPERVSRILLDVFTESPLLNKLSTVMQQPFPMLTHVQLCSRGKPLTRPFLTEEFLGASAPCLRCLSLRGIPFPSLSKVLLSATDLVSLELSEISAAGYIHPEDIISSLCTLTKLERLAIELRSRTPNSEQGKRSAIPQPRAILPTLTEFDFLGASEYLEDFVARFDAPLLESLRTTVVQQPFIEFPQLSQFILRTVGDTLPNEATIHSQGDTIFVTLLHHPGNDDSNCRRQRQIRFGITCEGLYWQVFDVAQICGEFLAPVLFASVKCLRINADVNYQGFGFEVNGNDFSHWMDIFRPFKSLESLDVSELMGPHIAKALELAAFYLEANVSMEQVSPVLRMIRFGSSKGDTPIERFVAMRESSGHPVTVHMSDS